MKLSGVDIELSHKGELTITAFDRPRYGAGQRQMQIVELNEGALVKIKFAMTALDAQHG